MKKLAGVVLALGAGYVAVSYYGGYAGEKALKQQIEATAEQGEVANYEIELESYERGLFTSQARIALEVEDSAWGVSELQVVADSDISHGPLLLTGRGLDLGLFASESDLKISTDDPEVNEALKRTLGETIEDVVMLGHFDQSYSLYWTIPSLDFQLDGGRFTLDQGNIVMRGDHQMQDTRGHLELGKLTYNDGQSFTLMQSPSRLNFDLSYLPDQVNYVGTMDYQADSLTLSATGSADVVLDNLQFTLNQELVNDRLNADYALTVDQLHGSPVPTQNLVYELSVDQVSPEALVAWQDLASEMQTAENEMDLAQHKQELMAMLDLLLQEGLALSTHVGSDVMDGKFDMKLDADYVDLPGDRTFKDITDPAEYLKLADADLVVKVSESVLMGSPLYIFLADYVDQYFVAEDELLVMRASLKDGQVTIGDQPFPLGAFLGN